MDIKDTLKLLIFFRLSEMESLLDGYTEMLPDIGCDEATVDIRRAQHSLDVAASKFGIRELFSEAVEEGQR